MKDKDLPAVYETSYQKTIKFLNLMRIVITEIKERVNSTTELKRNIEEKELPRGQTSSLQTISLPSEERSFERSHCLFSKRDTKKTQFHQR